MSPNAAQRVIATVAYASLSRKVPNGVSDPNEGSVSFSNTGWSSTFITYKDTKLGSEIRAKISSKTAEVQAGSNSLYVDVDSTRGTGVDRSAGQTYNFEISGSTVTIDGSASYKFY